MTVFLVKSSHNGLALYDNDFLENPRVGKSKFSVDSFIVLVYSI